VSPVGRLIDRAACGFLEIAADAAGLPRTEALFRMQPATAVPHASGNTKHRASRRRPSHDGDHREGAPQMNREFPTRLSARSIVVPVLAGTIAAGIFVLDMLAPLDVALAVLYVAVVLIAARFMPRRGVLLVALGCGGLAVAGYAISLQGAPSTVALVNLVIGLAAIGISAYLALLNQASEIASRERASLLDVAHEAIFVRDLDEAITYWNRGAEEQYGWTGEQALGKISHQLLHTVFPVPLEAIKDQLVSTGRWEGELVHTKRDGSTVVVASRWSLQKDGRGRPLATLETNNDITQHKRADVELRASERKYRNIFQTVAVSIWEEDFSAVKAAIDALRAQGVSDFRRYLAEHPDPLAKRRARGRPSSSTISSFSQCWHLPGARTSTSRRNRTGAKQSDTGVHLFIRRTCRRGRGRNL
jgi:PAS domain S-box-containing protein